MRNLNRDLFQHVCLTVAVTATRDLQIKVNFYVMREPTLGRKDTIAVTATRLFQ